MSAPWVVLVMRPIVEGAAHGMLIVCSTRQRANDERPHEKHMEARTLLPVPSITARSMTVMLSLRMRQSVGERPWALSHSVGTGAVARELRV